MSIAKIPQFKFFYFVSSFIFPILPIFALNVNNQTKIFVYSDLRISRILANFLYDVNNKIV